MNAKLPSNSTANHDNSSNVEYTLEYPRHQDAVPAGGISYGPETHDPEAIAYLDNLYERVRLKHEEALVTYRNPEMRWKDDIKEQRLQGHVTEDELAETIIANKKDDYLDKLDEEIKDYLDSVNERVELFLKNDASCALGMFSDEAHWAGNNVVKPSMMSLQSEKRSTLTHGIFPWLPNNVTPVDAAFSIYDAIAGMTKDASRFARNHYKATLVSASVLGVLATGVIENQTDNAQSVPTTRQVAGLEIETIGSRQVIEVDTTQQNIPQSREAVARAIGVSPKQVEVKGSKLSLPKDASDAQLVVAKIAFQAPDSNESTNVKQQNTDNVVAGSETENSKEIPQVQALNEALSKVDINDNQIDVTQVVEAIKQLDAWYAPNDPDRLKNMPAGYVKVLLPNEMPGLSVQLVPALKTANVERYTSPTAAATQYINAVFIEQLAKKYPQFANVKLRIRDNNSPAHATHSSGREVDMSTQNGEDVTQYSTGPMADYTFSENYSESYSIDMAVAMSKLVDSQGPVVSSLLTSNRGLIAKINGIVGRKFMLYHSDHADHYHETLRKSLALTTWRPSMSQLPWDIEQDLRIGSMVRPISDQQRASQHQSFEAWQKAQSSNVMPAETQPTANNPVEKTESRADNKPNLPNLVTDSAEQIINQLPLKDSQKDFLRKMLPAIIKVYGDGAKINPAVVLAQTSIETGFGNDGLSKNANNYFGMKANKNWHGPVYNAKTKEEYTAGTVVTITDGFKQYNSPQESVEDYARLIQNAPHYADAVRNYQNIKNYVNGLFNEIDDNGNIIKAQGEPDVLSYGTDRGYVSKVLRLINELHYPALVQAQLGNKSDTNQPNGGNQSVDESSTTTTSVVVNADKNGDNTAVEAKNPSIEELKNQIDLFSKQSAMHIFEDYFKQADGTIDAPALEKWVESLPTVKVNDEQRYRISVNNTPDKPMANEKVATSDTNQPTKGDK